MPRTNVSSRSHANSHLWSRVAVMATVGFAVAGCSDSARFNGPYAGNPHPPKQQQQEVTTGSIAQRAPTTRVVSQPLPQVSQPQSVVSGGTAGGSQGLGAYRPNSRDDVTGSVSAPAGRWTWDGGSPVTVGQGDTLDVIARRHAVPLAAIMETNGITDARSVRPGQRVVIPRFDPTATASTQYSRPAPQAAAPAPVAVQRPVAQAPRPQPVQPQPQLQAAQPAGQNVHTVAHGETLIGVARRYGVSLPALARANNMDPNTRVGIGDRLVVPGVRPIAMTAQRPQPQVQAPAPQQAPQTTAAVPRQPAPAIAQPRTVPAERVANAAPVQTARVATSEAQTEPEPVTKTAEAAGSLPSFRWPVRGRVIAGFGPGVNGVQNDGINLAVPEGTPIKAADEGVVAYAGNELKGYGNLVLIRHANGYVSAYANNSELLVKRGDSVKRGQDIARAGQTGNVTSPQLHFEIRKGSTPVDPMKYLGG